MKVNKVICLDKEIIEKLREVDNTSALINKLLIEHFGDNRTDEEIIADVKDKIKAKKDETKLLKEREIAIKKRIAEIRASEQFKKTKFGKPDENAT